MGAGEAAGEAGGGELAQELLELYAKRELARGHAFGADNAWQMEMEAAFPFVETQDQLDAISK